MKIEVTDNYVLVDGIFYYREQGDTDANTNVESENTCSVEDTLYDDNYDGYEHALSCGHFVMTYEDEHPNYCTWCGTKVKH